MMSVKFHTEENLIECVRVHECLYNIKSPHYRNIPMKQVVWEEIATELKSSADECKSKWNTIRNSYIHAVARRKKMLSKGVSNPKKWKYEEEMSFLLPFINARTQQQKKNFPIYYIEQDSDKSNQFEEESDKSIQIEEESDNHLTPQRKRKIKNYYEEPTLNVTKKRVQGSKRNEIDLFFETMAITVKMLPKLEQVKLKFKIMKMVHEVEIRCLDSIREPSASSSPSPPPFIKRKSSPYFRQKSVSPPSSP